MKQISILVPRGAASLGCIEGSFTLFTRANQFLQSMGRPPEYTVHLVGITDEPQVYDGLFTVRPDQGMAAVESTDLIIIPAVNGDMEGVILANSEFLPWIRAQHAKGAEVASLCVGAFILASTGLLEGRQCATHWLAANEFRKMFPGVHLVSDKVMTDEHGIYSSGGASSFWNLLLHILGKYSGRELAVLAAKYFAIEFDRNSQSPFTMFNGQRDHQDESVRQAQDYIEQNVRERITVEQLSSVVAVGRRSLERRFKKATCNTVLEYIRRVKIEAAKKGFETSRKNINEVMFDVGYSDSKTFRSVFRKTTGLSPTEYRSRYNASS